MTSYRKRKAFDAETYWDAQPDCVVCHERKTRNGDVCWKCRKAGRTTPTKAPTFDEWLDQKRATVQASVVSAPDTTPVSATTPPVPPAVAPQGNVGLWLAAIVALILVVVCLRPSTSRPTTYSQPYTYPAGLGQSVDVERRFYQKPPSAGNGDTAVRGHVRNGRYVAPYYRSPADGVPQNNYSQRGNVNPYTGVSGRQRR